ncbi:hypothetical protein J2X19_002946 [Rhodoferax ferrireducens]|uniref:Uncharacterized protein n=1 Tax=Rhodoferax ferrireducens TaxID=192843 RepID=A0ABU2CAA4_9BURK|nr:hypothetical protein [Rhodoferax ferrireducens]MDR7378267.1 hypothetical protein [Rhodoferax ferrireducens]
MQDTSASISVYDQRPFFEKALRFGLHNGLIDDAKLEAIRTDAPKGMVQIARYFGTEFLRPELEKSRERIVNLVSLHLEQDTGGDLHAAAELLRENSFLSRSKAGSEMLKALLSMPDNTHFSMQESGEFRDELIPVLARWTLKTLPEYQQELAKRSEIQTRIEAAFWCAQKLGVARRELQTADTDSEAVIRTALLAQAAGRSLMPNWAQFETAVTLLRKRAEAGKPVQLALPKGVPAEFQPVLQATLEVMQEHDLPKILDATVKPRKLFIQSLAFMGRYFWLDEGVDDISELDRAISDQWLKVTQRHTDDSSLITLFLCIATGAARKTTLTEAAAASIVRKIRKGGFHPQQASDFIREYAPHEHHADYQTLWQNFVEETQRDLLDERDTRLVEAMGALKLHCNLVKAPPKTAKPKASP